VSREDLRARRAEIDAAWVAGDPATADVTMTSIDARGTVIVGFRPSALEELDGDALPAAFEARFGSARLQAMPMPRAEAATFIRGGWSYGLDEGTKQCSFGFAVSRLDYPNNDYMLSAGHCADEGEDEQVWRDTTVGPVVKILWEDYGETDSTLIKVEDPFEAAIKVVNEIGGTPYVMDVKAHVPGNPEGSVRWFSGFGSATTKHQTIPSWGTDVTIQYDGNPGNYHVKHMYAIEDVYPHHGDSGGPVFWYNAEINTVKAAGIFAAISGPNDRHGWFTPIGRAMVDSWRVALELVPDAEGCHVPGHGGPGDDCPVAGGGDF
jgi:hypothetical protein